MTYDAKVPAALRQTQEWFGGVISKRIDAKSRINPIAPSGRAIKDEAPIFIAPSPTLAPEQRIELYNQQYWWRLLNTLQDSFPLTLRLFGYDSFNENIGKPYLEIYPPTSWSLNPLGDRLAEWVEKYYNEKDKALVLNCVKLDYLYLESFVAGEYPSISDEGEEALRVKPLILQPHVKLFAFPYDLFSFRREMLRNSVEYWIDNPFPTLSKKKKFYFVLSRSRSNDLGWTEITLPEFLLLEQMQHPQTVMQLCEWLEKQKREIIKLASTNLQSWFRSWTARRWIAFSQ